MFILKYKNLASWTPYFSNSPSVINTTSSPVTVSSTRPTKLLVFQSSYHGSGSSRHVKPSASRNGHTLTIIQVWTDDMVAAWEQFTGGEYGPVATLPVSIVSRKLYTTNALLTRNSACRRAPSRGAGRVRRAEKP